MMREEAIRKKLYDKYFAYFAKGYNPFENCATGL